MDRDRTLYDVCHPKLPANIMSAVRDISWGAKMGRICVRNSSEHYEELSFSYYSQNNSGQMMSKLVSDLFDISEFAHHGPENLFISLVKIVGSFIFLFLINKKLALPLIVLVILMFLFSFHQNHKMQQTFMENRKKSVM